MSFEVSAEAYDRFMGRFSVPLAELFVAGLDLAAGMSALDVGAGPGALTTLLVDALGADAVSAIDPSDSFVTALLERLPGVDVRSGAAGELPWPDGTFDVVVAQLVVHFMADPVAGLREMGRVTRPGGLVAATVWDFTGGTSPLSPFWAGVRRIDPSAPGEAGRPGAAEGELAELFATAGLADVRGGELTVHVDFPSFEDWWQPFTLGVGPAGAYLTTVDAERQAAMRAVCAEQLPEGAFTLPARAWSATGRAR